MNISFKQLVDEVAERVTENLQQTFEVEASGRHVHLSREDIDALFGKNYELTPAKYLSQPGQYAARERVNIVGLKGFLQNVVVLGPSRERSQVEISYTDAKTLGERVPVRPPKKERAKKTTTID